MPSAEVASRWSGDLEPDVRPVGMRPGSLDTAAPLW